MYIVVVLFCYDNVAHDAYSNSNARIKGKDRKSKQFGQPSSTTTTRLSDGHGDAGQSSSEIHGVRIGMNSNVTADFSGIAAADANSGSMLGGNVNNGTKRRRSDGSDGKIDPSSMFGSLYSDYDETAIEAAVMIAYQVRFYSLLT